VLFALLTEASIGQLFVASAIPALLAIVAYMLTVLLYVYWVPGSAPPTRRSDMKEVAGALRRCGPAAALFIVVLGGLYLGFFTDTEAAAVGAFSAFLLAVLRGKLRPARLLDALSETTTTTALVYPLIFGALIFAFFTGVSGLTEAATKFVAALNWPPIAVVALLLAAFVVFGTFMDSYAIMIVTVPIVTGLITGFGYDIIWWGILNLFVVEIGGISPPFGLTMYVLKNMADVPIATVFRGVMPFCIAAVFVLILLVAFPSITLWLPSTMVK
jgi:tripartite ATP-independent transporter DctM subunit